MKEERIFKIVEKSKLWFIISAVILVVCLGSIAFRGLNYGIDFVGGTVVNINMEKGFDVTKVRTIVEKYDKSAQVQEVQGNNVSIRSNNLSNEEVATLFKEIKKDFSLKKNEPVSSERIEPTIGKEITQKAIISSLVAILGILIYISLRFEWKFGLAAIASLIHDLIVTIGIFSIFQIPVNSSFIAAILTILGYSINDTVVVFDRIRENSKKKIYNTNVLLGDASLTQTMARSINTVLTVLIAITSLYIFGVSAIKEFALPLIIGIAFGGYSSIFIAVPVWVKLVDSCKKKDK
ncbi:protein translocase subunit SecF [Clostridium cylindrosporum]|uniref:Protein-export membrane protein SecF n=1 Tax=Clostridium cylindrosporum DSM 605 TaxID=1121307 RepID=A0A0J8D532_CLOCY|nr:protein translocase subunit SecF [Clostridium cylindrosporum]KMT21270.1 protein translocase subunit SecF [Clostridium cylindrosporum DSM 605]